MENPPDGRHSNTFDCFVCPLLMPLDSKNMSPIGSEDEGEPKSHDTVESLKQAILDGNAITVEKLLLDSSDMLDTVFDFSFPEYSHITRGMSPLIFAAALGRYTISKLLLRSGADIFIQTSTGGTNAFMITCMRNHFEIGKIIFEAGGPRLLEIRDKWDTTPLLEVAEAKVENHEYFQYLLDKGSRIEVKDCDEQTALHLAAKNGHLNISRTLLESARGRHLLELQVNNKRTPLLLAARYGKSDVFQYLLENGAYIGAADASEETALHLAAESGHLSIVQTIIKRDDGGQLLELQNDNDRTPLLLAARYGQFDIFQYLLENKADITAKDWNEETALHLAAENGHLSIVKFFLEKHGDFLEQRNVINETPLLLAAERGQKEILQYLIEHEANIEACSSHEDTVLHYAVREGHSNIVEILLTYLSKPSPEQRFKAAIAARNDDGNTPLNIAIDADLEHASIVFQLLESEVYFPRRPAQEEGFVEPDYKKSAVSVWLKNWISATEAPEEIKNHIKAVIYWALLNEDEELMELVTKYPYYVELNQEEYEGVTWLHVAARVNAAKTLSKIPNWEELILQGAERSKRLTPLSIAAKEGHYNTVQKLLGCIDKSKWLEVFFQRTKQEASLIWQVAVNGKSSTEKLIWERFLELTQTHEDLLSSDGSHTELAELAMGVAAWRYTRGKKEYFQHLMMQFDNNLQPKSLDSNPLALAVQYKFPMALWWLLSSSNYADQDKIREAKLRIKEWGSLSAGSSTSEKDARQAINGLLDNPPPLSNLETFSLDYKFSESDHDSQQGVVLDFAVNDRSIVTQVARRYINDIIYNDGPDHIMRELNKALKDIEDKIFTNSQSNEDRQPSKGTSGEAPVLTTQNGEEPRKYNEKVGKSSSKGNKDLPGSENAKIARPARALEPELKPERKVRWIHLPVNNVGQNSPVY
jgi:ankyrin repeat protein